MKHIRQKASKKANWLVVLPSQLNACEYPSHVDVVERVAGYLTDNTGGPRGQLALHPGIAQTILNMGRNIGREGGFDGLEHSLKREYGDQLGRSLRVTNGYLTIDTSDDDEIIGTYVKALIGSELMIAHDASVAGLGDDKTWPVPDLSGTRISVAYASAAPVNAYNNAGKRNADKQAAISALLIGTQYLLSVLFAARNDIEDVSLMPLGGGVFKNSLIRIIDAARFATRTANEICQHHGLRMPRVHILAYERSLQEVQELQEWMPVDDQSSSSTSTSTRPTTRLGTIQRGFPTQKSSLT
jgi:hypothetical protein